MEIIGLLISIMAISLSLFTYFKHDKKIKEQSRILNEYNIGKINKERIEAKRAIIESFVIRGEGGSRTIKVYNKGKAVAGNVKINFPDSDGFHVFNDPSPINIRPQNSVEIKIVTFSGGPDKIDLTYEWSDEFKENNKEVQTIQI
jgi:hypothetical protein